MKTKNWLLIGITSAVLLTGCSTSAPSVSEPASSDSATISESAGISTKELSGTEVSNTSALDELAVSAAIIKTGEATVITNDPTLSAADFMTLVDSMGGSIESSWQSDDDSDTYASVSARIPTEEYDALIAKLPDFGRIKDQSTSSENVGQQVANLDARIEVLKTSIDRLEALMKGATTTEDLLRAEEMMTQRQGELDSLNSQLSWLTDQVDMSTLTVSFSTESASIDTGFSWTVVWEMFTQSVLFVAYFIAVALPWILICLLVALIGVLALRRRRRRKASALTLPKKPPVA